jgi:osmotically-inducible protein OsmY
LREDRFTNEGKVNTVGTYLYKLTLILAAGASIAWGQAPAHDPPQKATPNVQAQNPSASPEQSTIPQAQQSPSAMPEQSQAGQTAKLPQSDAAPSTDLQSGIQAALQQEPSLKDASISVRQNDGAIELSGTALKREQKKTAERIAKANAAGKPVKNRIKVTGPPHDKK